jgi:hypothetical protein
MRQGRAATAHPDVSLLTASTVDICAELYEWGNGQPAPPGRGRVVRSASPDTVSGATTATRPRESPLVLRGAGSTGGSRSTPSG